MMRVLELFSGVGMFSYGLHKLGWETVAACDNDAFCKKWWSQKHPDVMFYDDVREVTNERLR